MLNVFSSVLMFLILLVNQSCAVFAQDVESTGEGTTIPLKLSLLCGQQSPITTPTIVEFGRANGKTTGAIAERAAKEACVNRLQEDLGQLLPDVDCSPSPDCLNPGPGVPYCYRQYNQPDLSRYVGPALHVSTGSRGRRIDVTTNTTTYESSVMCRLDPISFTIGCGPCNKSKGCPLVDTAAESSSAQIGLPVANEFTEAATRD